MSKYVGQIKERIQVEATLTGEYSFTKYFGWNEVETHIYTFKDEDDNVFVWKTSSVIGMDIIDHEKGTCTFDPVRKGDTFTCKATVKDHSEYKGIKQTVVNRVKVESVNHVPTKEEIEHAKAKEQLESIEDGDIVWEMPYKQYKEHYSDCETIAGSFCRNEYSGQALIKVIIRKGRLVPSGVRGQHFHTYKLTAEDGSVVYQKAVCIENAIRRAKKDFPDIEWDNDKVRV